MAKKKTETILIPIFEKKTRKRLEQNAKFKEQIKPFTRGISNYTNYYDRIFLKADENHPSDAFTVKSVVIDESFEEWIQKNNKKLSIGNLNEYMLQISKEEADILLKKYCFNLNLTLCAFPVVLIDKNHDIDVTNYKFSEEDTKNLQNKLESVYGEGNVWVPGIVTPVYDLCDCQKYLINKAFEYFSGKEKIRLSSAYDVQENLTYENYFALCVPFVVKNEFNSSVYDFNDISDVGVIDELESITYFVDQVNFLTEYEACEEEESLEDSFSITSSGFGEIIAKTILAGEGQQVVMLNGWDEWDAVMDMIEDFEEELACNGNEFITLNNDESYIDQLEEYIKDHRTATKIIDFLIALGTKTISLSKTDLDKVPDDEKENIVVFIDYVNERYYETIYPTMMERLGCDPDIFAIAEYFRFEMSAAGMKEDLEKLDPEIVEKAQEIVNKIWVTDKEQNFTFAIEYGEDVKYDLICKTTNPTSSKADESLYIILVHYCAAMMMLGGGLTVRTFVDKNREELFAIKGGNWDWEACSEEEIRCAYTRLPDGSYLEPDDKTVFTEMPKD